MEYKPKIFISCIYKLEKESKQKLIKNEVIRKVKEAGFEPQIFLESGIAQDRAWSFASLMDVLKRCDGAVILGLSRWSPQTQSSDSQIPTEYNHYEGALAASLNLPLLILSEEGIPDRGIFYNGGGFVYTSIPLTADRSWFDSDEYFVGRFNSWSRAVTNRYQVFLGYSGSATPIANELIKFLTGRLNLKVKEYKTSFVQGGSILEEIENACQNTQCGIFLFTADHLLQNEEDVPSTVNQAKPRDNVIFEAGYFIKAKGKERVLIILEEGVEMPADIGGNIYLPLKMKSIESIKADIQYFLEKRL